MKLARLNRKSNAGDWYTPIAQNIIKRIHICPEGWRQNLPPQTEYFRIEDISLWLCFSKLAQLKTLSLDWNSVQATSTGREAYDPIKSQWTLDPQDNCILLKLTPNDYHRFGLGQHRLIGRETKEKNLSYMRFVRVRLDDFAEMENPLTNSIMRDERLAAIFKGVLTTAYISANPITLNVVERVFTDVLCGRLRRLSSTVKQKFREKGNCNLANLDLKQIDLEELDRYLGSVIQGCSLLWMKNNDISFEVPSCRVIVEEGDCLQPFNPARQEIGAGDWTAVIELTALNAPCWRIGNEVNWGGGVSVTQMSLSMGVERSDCVSYVLENYGGL